MLSTTWHNVTVSLALGVDRNYNNWKPKNLLAVHQSCHQYIHMSKRENLRLSGAGYTETRTSGSKWEEREIILPFDPTK
jgi:hypothetical protein